ncbi:glycosyltransferase family 4 protein [Paenibacillus alkalitolerans]|uniref:glycosyltransferase family 4 protein n=1 Tax=Paenibacillus alkalitolerans TaxID=2799335 RepID=UPI0018F3FBB0|nr:glycosyltransferase family 4 protein [Paenibacillus alkalitolerans]
MKILLATYWYLPHVGGVHSYLQLLKQRLEARGHQVDILGHHPDNNHVYLLTGNRMIEKAPILYPLHDMLMDYFNEEHPELDDWTRYRYIERQVYEMASALIGINQYDIIHTQDVISTRAFARIAPATAARVATIHGLLFDEFMTTGEIDRHESLRWKYCFVEEYLGASSAHTTIVPTEWLRREYVNRFFVPEEQFAVIPYGLDIERIAQQTDALERSPRPDGKLVIICPGRLQPYKGQKYLIEALAKLAKVRDDFICQFAGEGVERAGLELMAQHLNLQDHIQFLGNRDDIYALLRAADLFVLPSLVENHSIAIMEAQIIGLPVISTNTGGNGELVSHLQTGVLVEPRNSDDLFQAMLMLMNDEKLRNKLSANGKRWGRKYWHPDHMIDRTLEIYERVIEKNK